MRKGKAYCRSYFDESVGYAKTVEFPDGMTAQEARKWFQEELYKENSTFECEHVTYDDEPDNYEFILDPYELLWRDAGKNGRASACASRGYSRWAYEELYGESVYD